MLAAAGLVLRRAMPYEIDFMPVGAGERSGDAIAIRYADPGGPFRVMVVDGGDKAAGQALVNHIRYFYGTNRVDYVVNTHPDIDHASGLEVVMEEMEIGELWLHRPWHISEHIRNWCSDRRYTPAGFRQRLCDALCHAHRLEGIAVERGIPIGEPFTGARIGDRFWVASPSTDWYVNIVHHFDKTPNTKAPLPKLGWMPLGQGGIIERAAGFTLAEIAQVGTVQEWWDYETLPVAPETSFDNESSVVLYGFLDGEGVLLTGDAGVQALNQAVDWLESQNVNPRQWVKVMQVPHHGSRHNIDPPTLDRILGPRRALNAPREVIAMASVGATSEHPRKVVTNAFRRRGAEVFTAKGLGLRHYRGLSDRANWTPAPALPFFVARRGVAPKREWHRNRSSQRI
jgi:beta-lactamase superfamily II metal-dependent hydrolase